jgi:protein-disulfide isomerase
MAENGASKATLWFIIGFIVLIIGGLVVAGIYSSGSSGSGSGFVATMAPAVSAADWHEGNPNAKVTLIEYGDFECPACGEYFPMVQQLLSAYSSTVLFVFRNYPLYQVHPNAGISAQAAEAAGLMGGQTKYWAMNSLLYQKQNDWATISPDQVVSQKFDGYAQSLGLDVNTFNKDVSASLVLDKIQADISGGNSAQIDHTPTFFVNLKQIPNPASYSDFAATLTQALSTSSATTTPSSSAK